jgi:YHS domain-containing protein
MEALTGKRYRQALAIMGMLLFVIAIATPTWSESQDKQAEASEKDSDTEISLVKVDPKYVCMPNNKLFKKEQLSTEIDGKTYYGCCKMCINALNTDPSQRRAVDPVSGAEIDKAGAIIGAAPDNTIYYFESEENLENFRLEANAEE